MSDGKILKNFATLLRQQNPLAEKEAKLLEVSSSIADLQALIKVHPIPDEFDGKTVWRDFMSPVLNQKNCSVCYSFSTMSALADRYALHTLGQKRPIFSPLVAVICMGDESELPLDVYVKNVTHPAVQEQKEEQHVLSVCAIGNTLYAIPRYCYRWGATEASCVSDSFIDTYSMHNNGELPICTNFEGVDYDRCASDIKTAHRIWPIHGYFAVTNSSESETLSEMRIQLEIMKWGPISAGFEVRDDFEKWNGIGIYIPSSNSTVIGGHAVNVVGWGISGGVKYWLIKNSWGTKYGDDGYFKIKRFCGVGLETNTVALWCESVDPSYVPSTEDNISQPKVTYGDTALRKYNNVNMTYFYPNSAMAKIKQGILVGDISKPFIDINKCPKMKDFWCYQIGTRQFEANDGTMIGPVYNTNGYLRNYLSNGKILGVSYKWIILFIIIGICMILIYHYRKKSNF